jgi:hypothetical protein
VMLKPPRTTPGAYLEAPWINATAYVDRRNLPARQVHPDFEATQHL